MSHCDDVNASTSRPRRIASAARKLPTCPPPPAITILPVICAARPHSFVTLAGTRLGGHPLHRRRRSSTPLLLIASLCIVAGGHESRVWHAGTWLPAIPL